jgi:hypothetical protein
MPRRLNASARIRFFIAALAAAALLTACTFVSRGTVVVSGSCGGCEEALTEDAVARAVAPVLERHGLLPVWSLKQGSGPCTGARSCSWAPGGKGWLQPWVLIDSTSAGQVRIRIESRYDSPGGDARVRALAEDVAEVLRTRFGRGNVAIERAG